MRFRPRAIPTAYLTWMLGGQLCGWHHLYLHDVHAFLWTLTTFGGLGFGAVNDLWVLSRSVAETNRRVFARNTKPVAMVTKNSASLSREEIYGPSRPGSPFTVPLKCYDASQSYFRQSLILGCLGSLIISIPSAIEKIKRRISTVAVCYWYDWILRSVIMLLSRPLENSALCWSLHRLIRPLALSSGIYLTDIRLGSHPLNFSYLLAHTYLLDLSREIIFQLSAWAFFRWQNTLTCVMMLSILTRGKRRPKRHQYLLSTCSLVTLASIAFLWYALLFVVVIREAHIPVAISEDKIYWDHVYTIGDATEIDENGVRTDSQGPSVEFQLPIKAVYSSAISSFYEHGQSAILFWASIPDADNMGKRNRSGPVEPLPTSQGALTAQFFLDDEYDEDELPPGKSLPNGKIE